MKKILIAICFIFAFITPAYASQVILNDDFNDTTYVDPAKTTAYVDTADSSVKLPKPAMPNAIDMIKYGDGYALTAADGVIIADYDDATGSLHDTKIDWLTNARGVSLRQDDMNLWVIGDDYVQYSQFSGGAYANDPALKASGLSNVLSVSAIEGTDKAVVLSKNADGTANITRYNAAGSLTVEVSKDLAFNNPVALSVINGTQDIVVVTKTEKHYLMFDDASQNYVEDTTRMASGLTDIASASANEWGTALLDSGNGKYLIDNDAGGAQEVLSYGVGAVPGGIALSIKPGTYDQAVITDAGEVRYYTYDDATDSMGRVPELEKTGILLAGGYEHPKDYYSKVITTGQSYDMVHLSVNQDLPLGTSITWYISSNGGTTWAKIDPGSWAPCNPGNQFVIHAVLDTTDTSITPRILGVVLEVSKLSITDLAITGITYPPGAPEQPAMTPPITTFPVQVYAGSKIQFEVKTSGFVEQVVAELSDGQVLILNPIDSTLSEVNTWVGNFIVSPTAVDGTQIAITLAASDSTGRKVYLVQNPFLVIKGNVASFSKVILTQ